MKKLLIALCATSMLMGATIANAAANTMKIGVVNVATLFTSASQGKAKLDAIKTKLEPKIVELKTSQADLTTKMKTFERNAPTMSKAKKEETAKSLATNQQDFQKQVAALQQQETALGQAAQQNFIAATRRAIDAVAAQDKFDMILTNQAAPFAKPAFDVTEKVLDEMKKS